MAEMRAERKSIFEYLSKNKFLIPMYQRNYVWSEDECEQLWEDVYNFFENKEEDEEYFLGSVVIYKEDGKQNIIDGQQRTTTLCLFIRALYEKARGQNGIDKLKDNLASCLWDINPLTGNIDFDKVHFKSEVATDLDNQSLENIFKDNLIIDKESKKLSLYEKNFILFQNKIDELAKDKPTEWFNFCLCLLQNCVILPIECDGRDKALRIFNTLNNRGVSLSPADIFKGLIFTNKNDKDRMEFAKEWKALENQIQNSNYLKKEDVSFLFTQYEHIIRAEHGEVDTVIPGVLEFWTKKDKENSKNKRVNFAANEDLLNKEETFEFIKQLGEFWCNPYNYLNPEAKKYFAILNTYQNRLWQMVVSVCFYKDKNDENKGIFDKILPQLVAYNALGLIYGKGGSSGLFWGLMKANVNIIKENKIKNIFESSINLPDLKMPSLENFIDFSKKARPQQIRYILSLYAILYNENQVMEWNKDNKNYSLVKAEIEHIFPRNWQNTNYNGWDEKEAQEYLEQVGNKMFLEKKLNIQAGNGYFNKKKEIYQSSYFIEAQDLAASPQEDWLKGDIENRNKQIYDAFSKFFTSVF
ncbi:MULTISPECIES: DUF262 domain-containing protein [Campylobacter]|uniref:DUF262 domain-containing protein n=1 Tax=Campylobacter TaxID=194 RepID=UPI000A32FFCB|nr:DUF262 domain-containing protein [Campylobacter sp. P0024]MCR8678448.1 DUF262 domain-containing HNH endonuclease family protein [Campylobacter sp. RM19072]